MRPTDSIMYLSQVIGNPVLDAGGVKVATVRDLVARFGPQMHPPLVGVVAREGRRDFFIERAEVLDISPTAVRLASFKVNLRPFARRPGEVLMRRDILDKQLIDLEGRRLVRANDLQLTYLEGEYRLVGVDVSLQALLRRLGPQRWTRRVEGRRVIDWEEVESFATDVPVVKLRVSHERLARLHPVDIAHLLHGLSARQVQEVLEAVGDETAADIVQELRPGDAAQLMGILDPERAADILDEMEPDDAADLLGDLPATQAERLLQRMEPDESAPVRELMRYEPDTAAGLMTTDFVAVPIAFTVAEALRWIRNLDEPPDPLYHVYLVESLETMRLVGVAPLRDVVLADEGRAVSEVSWRDYRSARPDEEARGVAHRMAEYNLAALPVVDEKGTLIGVVVVDDAMDVLLPDLWSRRLSRMYR